MNPIPYELEEGEEPEDGLIEETLAPGTSIDLDTVVSQNAQVKIRIYRMLRNGMIQR